MNPALEWTQTALLGKAGESVPHSRGDPQPLSSTRQEVSCFKLGHVYSYSPRGEPTLDITEVERVPNFSLSVM